MGLTHANPHATFRPPDDGSLSRGKVIDSTMEIGMTPFRIILGLVATGLFCIGFLATYNQSFPLAGRVGPEWFQSVSMYSGTALLLVALVLSIAAAQVGTRRCEVAGPRGLHLGRKTLLFGAVSLVVGLVLPVLMFRGLVPPILFTLTYKLPPIFIAVGIVLLRSSAVALRPTVSHAPRPMRPSGGGIGS